MADEANMSSRGFVITLFVVAALVCCGTPISGFYLQRKDKADEPGMRAAGEAYLDAAVRGDNGTAYDLLCAAEQRGRSRADWDATASVIVEPTGFRITDVAVRRSSDAPTQHVVTAEVTYPGHPSREVQFHLKKQDGGWKVCGPPPL
jgi:hypothetical protein